jgi:class 3 adenylate cyclase
MDDMALYKDRFENLMRVAEKITATLNVGDILETIRDQVKVIIPHVKEACLILSDPEASTYTRPLHCAMKRDQVNCQLCKKGKEIISKALGEAVPFQCGIETEVLEPVRADGSSPVTCEIALPIYGGSEPLGVLNVITEDGSALDDRDVVLLEDLASLASNTLINAKKYSKIARQKLTLERILMHIKPFVPETVHRIVEKNPEGPALGKSEIDVTVLFLDVADYTRISQTHTGDKVNFMIEKYFSAFLDIIYSYGGDVNETAGDGLMVIFQGDECEHALNAASAALEIRRRTQRINEELNELFLPVVVNMGINSGKALVGMSRFSGETHTRMTFTASGLVTNLASRLAGACSEGEILVGAETARRIEGKMVLWDRGLMSFKNFRDKLRVYSLVPPT